MMTKKQRVFARVRLHVHTALKQQDKFTFLKITFINTPLLFVTTDPSAPPKA